MAWTYSGDPAGSDRDRVRFLVGDTDTTDQLLQDAEIAYLLTARTDVTLAAADAADAIAAKFARKADTSNGALSVSASQRCAQYRALAQSLRDRARELTGAEVFAGGLTVSGNDALDADTDAVQPSFKRGMDSTGTDDED